MGRISFSAHNRLLWAPKFLHWIIGYVHRSSRSTREGGFGSFGYFQLFLATFGVFHRHRAPKFSGGLMDGEHFYYFHSGEHSGRSVLIPYTTFIVLIINIKWASLTSARSLTTFLAPRFYSSEIISTEMCSRTIFSIKGSKI